MDSNPISKPGISALVLAGVSGSGKTTLRDKLVEGYPDDFVEARQHTTRPQREEEGDVYEFISLDRYKELQCELTGRVRFNGHFYGTRLDYTDSRIAIVILSIEGLIDFLIKLKVNDRCFIVGLDLKALTKASRLRSDRDITFLKKEREVLNFCHCVYTIKKGIYAPPELVAQVTWDFFALKYPPVLARDSETNRPPSLMKLAAKYAKTRTKLRELGE